MNKPHTGLVEVFTGNGKGKTSAALGVVLRAAGQGLRSHIVYFMKGDFPYGEQKVLSRLPNVSFARFGFERFCDPDHITEEEREQARLALAEAQRAMLSGHFDLVVLDEVNVASAWGLIPAEEVLKLLDQRPPGVELILTGRYADDRLIQRADLVTEMVEVKHPFRHGIKSRPGIDF
ncbi:MAG TPA: cob(I)yrinic acid a,c-diamide adenosyltransferase [Dehalococcoidia bacterium]|nr:cob(I)yrinic acid a,c-diamide adenosyltransferase [Dehalococcoidia bacterium]